MAVARTNVTSEIANEIRAIVDDRVMAACAKDVDRLLANYSPDVLVFDLVNPLQYAGREAFRRRVQQWFSQFAGPIEYGVRDLKISADKNVAFCHSLNHAVGSTIAGSKVDMWWRATLCFCKVDGKWMVTHAHNSAPFDVDSGEASIDLKP